MKRVHVIESYGVFLGGDPRLFRPDPEAASEAQMANWRMACQTGEECDQDFCRVMQAAGMPEGPNFGLGVTTVTEECDGGFCCEAYGPP